MTKHNLKLNEKYFQAVLDGKKTAEVRLNDRNYQVDDTITMHEGQYDNGEFKYTGRKFTRTITYIDDYGVQEGYVVLSFGEIRYWTKKNSSEG